ncbi:MAG: hypothetical protein RMJ54_09400, partial [Roseiflexaceae bacterium]|nr:hypothetical protein [Roseiflexaceae bacterium]
MKTGRFAMFALSLMIVLMAVMTGVISGSTRAQSHLDVTSTPGEMQAFPVFPSTVVLTEHVSQISPEASRPAPLSSADIANEQAHVEAKDAPDSNHLEVAPIGSTSRFPVYLPVVIRDLRPIFFDDFSNPDSGWFV